MPTNNSCNYSPTQHDTLIGDANGGIKSVTNGALGTIWTSNGPGADPSWQTAPFNQIKRQVFTSTGTYTPTSGMLYCDIEVLGGGGAGGGANTTNASQVSVGGGGGAGEYARGIFSATSIGASKSVTIGAGGIGVSGTTGNSGGNSSVGALISANGGSGAQTSTGAAVSRAGGAGGTGGSGGDFRTPGMISDAFGLGIFQSAPALIVFNAPAGANSQYGSGGLPTLASSSNIGGNGSGYGAGGAGSANANSQSAIVGGNGSAGIVIITEYI